SSRRATWPRRAGFGRNRSRSKKRDRRYRRDSDLPGCAGPAQFPGRAVRGGSGSGPRGGDTAGGDGLVHGSHGQGISEGHRSEGGEGPGRVTPGGTGRARNGRQTMLLTSERRDLYLPLDECEIPTDASAKLEALGITT